MKALLSVSDKSNIVFFGQELLKLGYDILSTGGTLEILKANGIPAQEVSEYTQSPELFDGRIKTLHPKIHGGILFRRHQPSDCQVAKNAGIQGIDIVCVNLYPFKQTIQRTQDFDEIIENIDIGGPTLIRAAAKNFASVLVITSPNDYENIIKSLKENKNNLELRQQMMIQAFEHTAAYDAIIANYMNQRFNGGFGAQHFISAKKVAMTKYGENPHQKGAIYEFEDYFSQHFKCLKGEASFNNHTDLNQALKIATNFGDKPAITIVKHGNPCGFALKDSLMSSFQAALMCDPISAYGGVLAVNGIIDKALAEQIHSHYFEIVIAGRITEQALQVFADKKRIKLFELGKDWLFVKHDAYDFKHIEGGFVLQETDKVCSKEILNAKQVSKRKANEQEMQDLNIAYRLAALVKSNCVVYVKNSTMVAIGMGMTSRVDATKAALRKAQELELDISGAVLASEAFFPFKDSIEAANSAGISAIIEPGGSIRDNEVIESADSFEIALYFSGVRHFYH